MMKIGGKRNYAFGKSIRFATANILREKYGEGRFATRHSHRARLKPFAEFLRRQRIRDLRDVDQSVVTLYAQELADAVDDEFIARSTAINRLSSVNVLMSTAREDGVLVVSPSAWLGRRSYVCTEAPLSLNRERIEAALEELMRIDQLKVVLAVLFCRYLGCRIREAALLNLVSAIRSANRNGVIRISEGTKGGRGKVIPREINVTDGLVTRIEKAASQIPEPNLIPVGERFCDWYLRSYRIWRGIARRCGLRTGYHDFRRGFACERYRVLTGHDAPCVSGMRTADADADLNARMIISVELGHGRPEIVSAYVGGRR